MVWDSVQSVTRCFWCFKRCFYIDLWFAFKHCAGCQLCYAVLAVWQCGSWLYVWLPIGRLSFTFAFCRTSCKSNSLASDMPHSCTMLIWSTPTCLWMTWGRPFLVLLVATDLRPGPAGCHIFFDWQGALQLFGGFQWSGVQPEVEQAAVWSNRACLQQGGCSEWVDKSGDIAWECTDMWKIRFQNHPADSYPKSQILQHSQLYEQKQPFGQTQAYPDLNQFRDTYVHTHTDINININKYIVMYMYVYVCISPWVHLHSTILQPPSARPHPNGGLTARRRKLLVAPPSSGALWGVEWDWMGKTMVNYG